MRICNYAYVVILSVTHKCTIIERNGPARIIIIITMYFQWAYGVTCWEVYTGGRVPYAGLFPREVSRQLLEGYRLKKPTNAACTDEL